jgi:hypothetical protein
MNKITIFEKELTCVKNPDIRLFIVTAIESLPNYFFEIPASSSGKYHPDYALGEGGLVRHTKATIRIALELFRMDEFNFTEVEKDLILASLFVHDGWKSGVPQQDHTLTEHPLLAVSALSENDRVMHTLSDEYLDIIFNNILSHMGQWNKDNRSGVEILPKPKNKMQIFVHLCDYLASRKCIEINFDVKVERN